MDSSITMKNALYLYNVLANVCKYRRLGESPSLSACQLPMPSAYRPGKYESKRNSKPVIGDFALYVLTRCNPLPFSGIGRGYPSSFQYSSATVHGHKSLRLPQAKSTSRWRVPVHVGAQLTIEHRQRMTSKGARGAGRVQSSFEFGQKVPPLVRLLKDILERYPEGGQILKVRVRNTWRISRSIYRIFRSGTHSECRRCGSHRSSISTRREGESLWCWEAG
jgi:hypothetical protein